MSQPGAKLMNPQDPLAQLRDIIEPGAISWWPLAMGWWILLAIVFALLIATVLWLQHQRRVNAYRRAAKAELHQLWRQYQKDRNTEAFLSQLIQLLRRTFLFGFPGQGTQTLQGESWLALLDSTLAKPKHFQSPLGRSLLSLPYRANPKADCRGLCRLVQYWIDHHRRTTLPAIQRGARHAAV